MMRGLVLLWALVLLLFRKNASKNARQVHVNFIKDDLTGDGSEWVYGILKKFLKPTKEVRQLAHGKFVLPL